jgi:hypothetical protein
VSRATREDKRANDLGYEMSRAGLPMGFRGQHGSRSPERSRRTRAQELRVALPPRARIKKEVSLTHERCCSQRLRSLANICSTSFLGSVRKLIALLDKEFRWKTTESAVTGHLYTRRDRLVHTPPDRSSNRPVTWFAGSSRSCTLSTARCRRHDFSH